MTMTDAQIKQDSARVDFLTYLREINSSRLAAWEGDQKADGMFHAAELAGGARAALNLGANSDGR